MPFNISPLVKISITPAYVGYLWLIIALILLLAELGTPGLFFFIAFAGGAVVAAIAAFMGYAFVVQCLVALGAAIGFFWLVKYWFASGLPGQIKTNISALVGKAGVVVKVPVRGSSGYIKVRGEVWAARTAHPESLQAGSRVKVIRVEGNNLIIEPF